MIRRECCVCGQKLQDDSDVCGRCGVNQNDGEEIRKAERDMAMYEHERGMDMARETYENETGRPARF